jgi:hypothetical protein
MGRKERKQDKAKQVWMSVLIAFLMIFSVFGVIIGSQDNSMKYGKFKFSQAQNGYVTKINGKDVPFYSLPSQSSFINVSSDVKNLLNGSYFIVVSFDPLAAKESLSAVEVARFDFSQYFEGKLVYNAVTNNTGEYSEQPVITCANATAQTPVIYFNFSDTPGIINVDNCIFINAKGSDVLVMRDRLLFSYFGVILDE